MSLAVARTDPLSGLIAPEADDLNPEDWATPLVQLFSANPTSRGAHSALESWTVDSFVSCVQNRAATRRHAGRLDQARRIADRLHAFARQLVARYPDQAIAYWALGQAYIEIYKNAWRIPDRALVERYLKLAVDSHRHALVLDPDNDLILSHLAYYEERLSNLLSPARSVKATEPFARSGPRDRRARAAE